MLEYFFADEPLQLVVALVLGTLVGFVCGLVPGLGGRIGLVLSMPLAVLWEPVPAAIYLFALHSVIHTSSSIPAIAFGMPSSAADAATVLDGYPLAKTGRAGEALGASLSASALGGVLGALAFFLAIPVARPIVTSMGPPELLLLSLFGITLVSTVSEKYLLRGLAVACLGTLFSMVGYDIRTGEPRLAFGMPQLADGLSLPALVTGMFVIPEMLAAMSLTDDLALDVARATSASDVMKGMLVTFRYKMLLLRSSLYGIAVGVMPGVGASVSVWLAYAHAARSVKSETPFGQGAIAGVIAPEAANNSKEGGAMIPTLFFGIPGSSSMAIMMAALGIAGVSVGPNMLGKDINLTYLLGGTVVLANLIAIPLFIASVPWVVRLSALKRELVAPFSIAIAVTATLINSPESTIHLQLLVTTVIGLVLKRAGWPRAPFILGFVLGGLVETSSYQTAVIWGWSALWRPITIVLLVLLITWMAYLAVTRRPAKSQASQSGTAVELFLGAIFLAAILAVSFESWSARWPVGAVAVLGIATTVPAIIRSGIGNIFDRQGEKLRHVGATLAFLLATPVFGVVPSAGVYLVAVLRRSGTGMSTALLLVAAFLLIQYGLLAMVFDVSVEREIVGRLLWTFFWR
jgi:putative tricarboxylic transport membrane protein